MTFKEALEDLFSKWDNQRPEFVKKWKAYKSRHLNLSGNQIKKVSKDKLSEMLKEARYKEDWKKVKKYGFKE